MPVITLPVHPRTGLTAVGLRRDGRPIWPILGGAGGEDSTDSAPPATPSTTPTSPTVGEPPSSSTESAPTAAEVEQAKQAADAATAERDQAQAVLDAITRAINPNGDSEADPAKLAEQTAAERDEARADVRRLTIELAAHKAAAKAGADPMRLLDSRAVADQLADLDPADPKFGEQLDAALSAAVEANPLLRATPAGPPRGGTEFNGAPTAPAARAASLHDAVAARLAG